MELSVGLRMHKEPFDNDATREPRELIIFENNLIDQIVTEIYFDLRFLLTPIGPVNGKHQGIGRCTSDGVRLYQGLLHKYVLKNSIFKEHLYVAEC